MAVGNPFGLEASVTNGTAGTALFALIVIAASVAPRAGVPSPVHQQRYAMGTLFEIVLYHPSRDEGTRAAGDALSEVVRLDRVMSHFRDDSDLAALVRGGRNGFVPVEPSLYDVIQQSIELSRRTGGVFDITIAPLLRAWQAAHADGRVPSGAEIAGARRCVGYQKIEMQPPDRIRLHAGCADLDLGGIGKGYAVDRAIGILKSAGIRHAIVNAGGSSIGAIGAPPGRDGWPVRLDADGAGGRTLLLRDESLSTSHQPRDAGGLTTLGEIIDPRRAGPAESRTSVTVVAPDATTADALSTTLVIVTPDRGRTLIAEFAGVSAIWSSPEGATVAAYGPSGFAVSELP